MTPRRGAEGASSTAAWHENFVEAIASIARAIPTGEVRPGIGGTIVRSGLALASFNCLFALDPPSGLDGLAEELDRTFTREGTPWVLITTAETSVAFVEAILALHLQRRGTLPGMVWDPLPSAAPPAPKELEIRPVREAGEVRTFARTMMEGFEAAPALMDPRAEAVAATSGGPRSPARYYLGYVGHRPACTAVRYSTRGTAGIYGVATRPEFRRRGFGAAVTYRAALDGRSDGCSRSYLQSSAVGRSVYEKIGYRFVEEYHLWGPATSPSKPPA
jgi:GNAT superfamily N-acetyltransferase